MAYKSKYTSAEIENKLDVVYNKYFNPVVPDEPVEPEPLPLGVLIQHVDGSLYTTDEWTAKGFASADANGVAVSAEECAFVIAKDNVGNHMWASSTSTLIKDALVTEDETTAISDYKGENNTKLMLATDTSGAGYSCANYSFPNGKKGYLPALGELKVANNNMSEINVAMAMISGTALNGTYWSSTQSKETYAWAMYFGSYYGSFKYSKVNTRLVRPFTTL